MTACHKLSGTAVRFFVFSSGWKLTKADEDDGDGHEIFIFGSSIAVYFEIERNTQC